IVEVTDYQEAELEKAGIFDLDILFISTGDEAQNAKLAKIAKDHHVERVIARIESPELAETMKEQNIEVFSTILSTTSLMKALIESPSIADILTNRDTALHEIEMLNQDYDRMTLREFPFVGDVIVVRIFRGNDSIVP